MINETNQRLNNIIIEKEIGKGYSGTVYKVKHNNNTYALKRQKVYPNDHKGFNESEIWYELKFFEFIDTLSDKDKHFFMKLYEYKFYDNCDYKWEVPKHMPITKPVKILLDSKSCLDILSDLKDGDILDLINNNKLNKTDVYKLIIQFMYILYILHKNNYRHYDNNGGNICFKTNMNPDQTIYLKQLNMELKNNVYQYSLIDYASCITSQYKLSDRDKRSYEDNIKYNMDLFVFIQKVLLKIDDKIYKNIIKLDVLTLKTLFDRSNTGTIINSLKKDNIKLYNEIKNNILKIHPHLEDEYSKIETDSIEIKTYSRNYSLEDDICQYIAIYDKKYYCKIANLPYLENMIGTNELLFMKKNYNNIVDIIKYFMALL